MKLGIKCALLLKFTVPLVAPVLIHPKVRVTSRFNNSSNPAINKIYITHPNVSFKLDQYPKPNPLSNFNPTPTPNPPEG